MDLYVLGGKRSLVSPVGYQPRELSNVHVGFLIRSTRVSPNGKPNIGKVVQRASTGQHCVKDDMSQAGRTKQASELHLARVHCRSAWSLLLLLLKERQTGRQRFAVDNTFGGACQRSSLHPGYCAVSHRVAGLGIVAPSRPKHLDRALELALQHGKRCLVFLVKDAASTSRTNAARTIRSR